MGSLDALIPLREAFEDALAEIGAAVPLREADSGLAVAGVDLVGRIDDLSFVVEIKTAPSVADVRHLQSLEVDGVYKVLVGGRISAAVRNALREAGIGYYDARGHLRLMHPPLRIDAPVQPAAGLAGRLTEPLSSPAALDVALGLLHEPDIVRRFGVRRFAAEIDRSPSLVSTTLARLRDDFLITDHNEPVVPDLFQAVLLRWKPKRISLARMPPVGSGQLNERLQLNPNSLMKPGWALTDGHAAALWGAPVVVGSTSPLDFYVPSERVVGLAIASLEQAPYGEHECTVAVQPAPLVCLRRVDLADRRDAPFPVVRPVIVALDLAADPGRGQETLDLWSERLPTDINRVW